MLIKNRWFSYKKSKKAYSARPRCARPRGFIYALYAFYADSAVWTWHFFCFYPIRNAMRASSTSRLLAWGFYLNFIHLWTSPSPFICKSSTSSTSSICTISRSNDQTQFPSRFIHFSIKWCWLHLYIKCI